MELREKYLLHYPQTIEDCKQGFYWPRLKVDIRPDLGKSSPRPISLGVKVIVLKIEQ